MLTCDEGAALLAPLAGASGVLLAVSGGPDSMALLHLAVRWRAERAAGPALFAATVDHGLRAESAAEAAMVSAFARQLGVPHATLPWTGVKPATRLQERAREARYALLAAHAKAVGASILVTAHHADDQVETLLMRLLHGSAIGGLAGMRPMVWRSGLALARPLLPVAKAQLVAHCEAAGVPFVRDPANEDPRFGRARARRLAVTLAEQGLGREAWSRLARRAARAEDALAAAAAEASSRFAAARADGAFQAPMAEIIAFPEEVALRLIGAEAARVGRGAPPRLERLEAAWERLRAAHGASRRAALTLAGAQITLDTHGFLTMSREPPRRRGVPAASKPCSVHADGLKSGPDVGCS